MRALRAACALLAAAHWAAGWAPSAEEAALFAERGVLRIGAAVSAEGVALLRNASEWLRANPSPRTRRKAGLSRDPIPCFFHDYGNWHRCPPMGEFLRLHGAELAAGAAALMGSDTATLYMDHVLIRDVGCERPAPWHQDIAFYPLEGRQGFSMWIPLSPVAANESLEVVSGSHSGENFIMTHELAGEADAYDLNSPLAGRRIDPAPEANEQVTSEAHELAPGDAVAFSMWATHRAPSTTTSERWVVSLRWVGDDMRKVPRRPWAGPAVPGQDDLPDGVLFHGAAHANFPTWRPGQPPALGSDEL